MLLLIAQPELEEDVVVIDDVTKCRESSVVKVATLVRGFHEQAVLAHEEPREVHRLVRVIRRPVGLEAVDADLRRLVEIPARLGP